MQYNRIFPHLNERARGVWLGNEALEKVEGWRNNSKTAGVDRATIAKDQKEDL